MTNTDDLKIPITLSIKFKKKKWVIKKYQIISTPAILKLQM